MFNMLSKVTIMNKLICMLAFLAIASLCDAQKKAVTKTGEEVILFDNGTWKFANKNDSATAPVKNNPEISESTKHPVMHFEIGCKDIRKTTEFYTSLFNWTPTNAGIASYINTNSPEGIQGHLTSLGHEPNNYVTVYIQVENIEEQLKKIEKAGGQKIIGPIRLPTGEKFAWFKDIDGNIIGLLTKPGI